MAGEPTSKERMLKNIRKALIDKKENPYPELESDPLYAENPEYLDLVFATEFIKVKGNFIFCSEPIEFVEQFNALVNEYQWSDIRVWDTPLKDFLFQKRIKFNPSNDNLKNADVGFTLCEALIARNGSVLVSSGMESGRSLMILPPVHIVLAFRNQLVFDIKQGLFLIKEKYGEGIPSSTVCITGPSRTADIEKTLVLGAHGPKQLFVFLIDQEGF